MPSSDGACNVILDNFYLLDSAQAEHRNHPRLPLATTNLVAGDALPSDYFPARH